MIHTLKVNSHTSLKVIHLMTKVTSVLTLTHKEKVLEHIQNMLPDVSLEGQWSVDIMQNGYDFWIIDMATADTSALSSCVPAGKLKKSPEDWLPKLEQARQ